MTRQQFNTLSKERQQEVVLQLGMFLSERTDGSFEIMLYQLENFYVEVYLISLYNKVALFRSFEDTELLQPYLAKIDISALLQEVFS